MALELSLSKALSPEVSFLSSLLRKKFVCSKCDFITKRNDSLYSHYRRVHNMYNRNLAAISEKIASMGHTTCFDCGNVVDAEDLMRQSNCELTANTVYHTKFIFNN